MKKQLLLLGASILLVGCGVPNVPVAQDPDRSNLTSGQVSLTLKKNETTQAEVAEVFGAPNLVTNNADGEDVWIYQKHATVANQRSVAGAGGLGGVLGTVFLGGAVAGSSSSQDQSSRTMTLVIKFRDVRGVKRVVDFSSRYTSF